MTPDEEQGDAVLEQIWTEIQQLKNNSASEGNSDTGTVSLSNHLSSGFTTDEASQMRESVHNDAFNVVPPPVDCPAWLCIMLPCINHLKSMKAHKNCIPEDAEVLRNAKWTRYDAASLVVGDVIRLEEGDVVPADCVIAVDDLRDDDLLVDLRVVTGLSRPKQFNSGVSRTRNQRTLMFGGTVVQGHAMALVTAIGTETVLGKLIASGKFPIPDKDSDDTEETMTLSETTDMATMEMGSIS
mmetsp:Transcript_21982/g.46367  ORF Transcript_21982/g.46367 Transcript_21982/m.46367 type:complete len:241 (-) Transcript_21982:304-1026(-)|eukprot:CAMPEP_0201134370 /NCGR_PEP_ID=MMETSP0850-20130426/51396_1 /ASSEMBLY_ACC=CAM_ASM_000622 /TAXON_ID=183588 /ORGANISM="Pseudo-nitzschia fraudulenta, Strain WWA7" /LENGTH=240 /DNA_ID=CAMNT_0047405233 /DNA_START=45 /DNA_END=767 /DNA_ORIENTATION=-